MTKKDRQHDEEAAVWDVHAENEGTEQAKEAEPQEAKLALCSFCGKDQNKVQRLIAGPFRTYICNECIERCREILETEQSKQNITPKLLTAVSAIAGLSERAQKVMLARIYEAMAELIYEEVEAEQDDDVRRDILLDREFIEDRVTIEEALKAAQEHSEGLRSPGDGKEPAITESSGNVFADLGLPDAEERFKAAQRYIAQYKAAEEAKKAQRLHYAMTIVWSEEDQCYLVQLPEWAAHLLNYKTATHGDTYEEAAKNGREVLEMLLEGAVKSGERIPEPLVWTKEDQESEDKWDKLFASSEDNEEYSNPLPPEYYEALQRKTDARHEALGIMDLPLTSRDFCEVLAEHRIRTEGIADEEAKRAVHAEVKRVVLETIENMKKPLPEHPTDEEIREDIADGQGRAELGIE